MQYNELIGVLYELKMLYKVDMDSYEQKVLYRVE